MTPKAGPMAKVRGKRVGPAGARYGSGRSSSTNGVSGAVFSSGGDASRSRRSAASAAASATGGATSAGSVTSPVASSTASSVARDTSLSTSTSGCGVSAALGASRTSCPGRSSSLTGLWLAASGAQQSTHATSLPEARLLPKRLKPSPSELAAELGDRGDDPCLLPVDLLVRQRSSLLCGRSGLRVTVHEVEGERTFAGSHGAALEDVEELHRLTQRPGSGFDGALHLLHGD